MQPKSIYRFYRPVQHNIDTLLNSELFLYSAKKWKPDGELDFQIDNSNKVQLRHFILEEVKEVFSLPKDDPEYIDAIFRRGELLQRHGAIFKIGESDEIETIVYLIIKEINSLEGLSERKGLIRKNFISKTGICCFTADENTLSEDFHWNSYADYGEGFCVEYDWDILLPFFSTNNVGIAGDYIKYYPMDKRPKLILSSEFSDEVIQNYSEIIFSLRQAVANDKEFRLAKIYQFPVDDTDQRRKYKIPSQSIKSVTFGHDMRKDQREMIAKKLSTDFPHVELFQTVKEPGKIVRHPYS